MIKTIHKNKNNVDKYKNMRYDKGVAWKTQTIGSMTAMTGKTHMLGGIASGLAVCYTLDCIGYGTTAFEMAAGMMAASVLSLLPDVDEKNSTIGRKLVILPMMFAILQIPSCIEASAITSSHGELSRLYYLAYAASLMLI